MQYLRNCWYVACLSGELGQSMLARTICEQPLAFFRSTDGAPAALTDACSHRLAPLSAGCLKDGEIMCRYHGLRFGRDGRCTHNPHGPATASLAVRSWPSAERHDLVWVWLGDPDAADPAQIPDLSFIDTTPPHAKFTGYLETAANFELCTDNILDLTHTDYLHPDTLGGGGLTRARGQVTTQGDTVAIRWENPAEVAPPALDREFIRQGELSDTVTQVEWVAPAILRLSVDVAPLCPDNGDEIRTATMHIMTPESPMRTHYFVVSTRNFRADDADYNAGLAAFINGIFLTDDKPMLEAQQARMGTADLWACNPAMLAIDAASVQARRVLQRLIAAEQHQPENADSGTK